jgi:hypothetical protein
LLSIPASEPENDRPALQENLAEFSAISLIATNSKTILSFLRSTGNAPHPKKWGAQTTISCNFSTFPYLPTSHESLIVDQR